MANLEERELWALPIYAVAGEQALTDAGVTSGSGTESGPGIRDAAVCGVSAAQLRYRLIDRTRYTRWLCARLQRLGHRVRHPQLPAKVRGVAADLDAVHTLLRVHAETDSPTADDPVANRWRLATAITAGSAETTEGATVTFRPDCALWRYRATMIRALDALLINERGGWPAGTRVRTRGLPEYIHPSGKLAHELGVAPDRAIVAAAVWDLDHHHHTLAGGPPIAYHLQFRDLRHGQPIAEAVNPVRAHHLTIDLDPFPGPVRTAATATDTGTAAQATTPAPPHHAPEPHDARVSADPTDAPRPVRSATEPARGDARVSDPVSRQDAAGLLTGRSDLIAPADVARSREATDSDADSHAVAGLGELNWPGVTDELAALSAPRAHARPLPWAMAATDDPFRIAALQRVWMLRDTELSLAGDATPHRVAERIADHTFPAPTSPMQADELAFLEREDHRSADPELAPWCEPDQQLVTGYPRTELRQWLDAMRWCTRKQRRVLDGFTKQTTVSKVRAFLAEEGFVEVRDVRSTSNTGTGRVDLILVNVDAGWLATVHAADVFGLGITPERITVYYNVAALDGEIIASRQHDGGWYHDNQRRLTHVRSGSVTVNPRLSWPRPSLRVELAVLRAFARPVTPWLARPHVHIGADGTPPTEQHRVLASLPAHIHDLFGPYLLPAHSN